MIESNLRTEERDDAGATGEADAGSAALSDKGRRELARQVRPFSLPKPVGSITFNALTECNLRPFDEPSDAAQGSAAFVSLLYSG